MVRQAAIDAYYDVIDDAIDDVTAAITTALSTRLTLNPTLTAGEKSGGATLWTGGARELAMLQAKQAIHGALWQFYEATRGA